MDAEVRRAGDDDRPAGAGAPRRNLLVVAGVVVAVLVAAVVGRALTDGDDFGSAPPDDTRSTRPVRPTAVATTATVPRTAAATTPVPTTAAPATTVAGAIAPAAVVGVLVPYVAAYEEALPPSQQRAQIVRIANNGRHDVAVPGPVRTLCAAVRVEAPIVLAGRWERDGETVASTAESQVDAPGLGDCLGADEPLAAGAYQFLVVDEDGNESAAGTIVVGATTVPQRVVNGGEAPICALRVGPASAAYYDGYLFDGAPIEPGDAITLVLAAVEHDIEATSCQPDAATVVETTFTPDAAAPLALTSD